MKRSIAEWALKNRLNNFDCAGLGVAVWVASEGHVLAAILLALSCAIASTIAETLLGLDQ